MSSRDQYPQQSHRQYDNYPRYPYPAPPPGQYYAQPPPQAFGYPHPRDAYHDRDNRSQQHHHHSSRPHQQYSHSSSNHRYHNAPRPYDNSRNRPYNNNYSRHSGPRHQPTPQEDLQRFPRALEGRQELFAKRFQFTASNFTLPKDVSLFTADAFELGQMQELKESLNKTKSKLDSMDLEAWKRLTAFTNQTGDIVYDLRKHYDPEMCTKAWTKMFEMLSTQSLLKLDDEPDGATVATAHICEAPGAFIAATNHYIRQHADHRLTWDWLGLSLNPYFEGNDLGAMIDDDSMILGTLPHWYFGRDDSGNIMSQDNIRGLWEKSRELGAPIKLITGDGSIDCSSNPNEQETVVSALHYAEFVAVLGMLAVGGNAVLKLFTLFEHETICLLYLMGCLFDSVVINKPATSTSANSEVYVLLYGYRGCDLELREQLLSFVSADLPQNRSMFALESLPEAFIQEMIQCAKQFSSWQQVVIERNLSLEARKTKDEEWAIRRCKQEVVQEYLRLCPVTRIKINDRLVPDHHLDGSMAKLNTSGVVGAGFGKQRKVGGDLAARQREKEARQDYLDAGRKRRASASTDTHDSTTDAASTTVREDDEVTQVSDRDDEDADASDGKPKRLKVTDAGADAGQESSSTPVAATSVDLKASDIAEAALPSGQKGETSQYHGHYSTEAREMMAKMKHEPGTGLGVASQGMAAPIEVVQRSDRGGLGALPSMPTFSTATDGTALPDVIGEPLFDDTDGFESVEESWLSPPHSLRSRDLSYAELSNSGWQPFVSTPLPQVILSKFCREKVLRHMRLARDAAWPVLLADLSQLEKSVNSAFLTASQLAHELSYSTGLAAQLAHLDAMFDFTSKTNTDSLSLPLRFLDLTRSATAPLCEYLVRSPRLSLHGFGFGEQQSDEKLQYRQLTDSNDCRTVLAEMPIAERPELVFLDNTITLDADLANSRNPERLTRARLLEDLATALTAVASDGWIIIRLGDMLSRATISVIFILHALFKSIQIIKPWSCPAWKPDRFVVCRGYSGGGDGFVQLLREVSQLLAEHPDLDLLSLAPMQDLLSPGFYRYIILTNERLAHREVHALQKLQFLQTHPDTVVPSLEPSLAQAAREIRDGLEPGPRKRPALPVPSTSQPSTGAGQANPLYARFVATTSTATEDQTPAADDASAAKPSSTSQQSSASQSESKSESTEEALPTGWTKVFSNSKNKYYYYHDESGVSQWTPPSGSR